LFAKNCENRFVKCLTLPTESRRVRRNAIELRSTLSVQKASNVSIAQ
jgi:hypothetical protein